ncbi:poly-gamma-glutamate hydrolase family protein [Streptomyces sp. NPDC006012]|uniref:poly-gamma-glutamate hydrolase family protein n=1 Tax=Streptomyces sp. NPDC006012 TaxID=3364739 RepID=UPI00369E33FE
MPSADGPDPLRPTARAVRGRASALSFAGRSHPLRPGARITLGRGSASPSADVVSVHGCKADQAGAPATRPEAVVIGGRNTVLRQYLDEELSAVGVQTIAVAADDDIAGVSPDNICNRTQLGMGAQLELTTELRASMLSSRTRYGRRWPAWRRIRPRPSSDGARWGWPSADGHSHRPGPGRPAHGARTPGPGCQRKELISIVSSRPGPTPIAEIGAPDISSSAFT